MKVLILGVDGFIGSALTRRILRETDWQVYGMDVSTEKIGAECLVNERLTFLEGDITINREWIEYHVKKCDVVLPLVAIATPATYVRDPLSVFELDFEANLPVVRWCAKYGTRLVFPSTSEVYGDNPDRQLDESTSRLIYGPIRKSRWIYACSKQLLDRVIAAYGAQRGLEFTCVRPFNWIGPRLDDLATAKEGSSRVVTQFIANLLEGKPIKLVDGGEQRRCFTWIEDGIDALMAVLENRLGVCDGEIINIGNPDNECSIRELAQKLVRIYESWRAAHPQAPAPEVVEATARVVYGEAYQDIHSRRPSIAKAERLLGWRPRTGLDQALQETFDSVVKDWGAERAEAARGNSVGRRPHSANPGSVEAVS